jgi:uncharacterized membrane protein
LQQIWTVEALSFDNTNKNIESSVRKHHNKDVAALIKIIAGVSLNFLDTSIVNAALPAITADALPHGVLLEMAWRPHLLPG